MRGRIGVSALLLSALMSFSVVRGAVMADPRTQPARCYSTWSHHPTAVGGLLWPTQAGSDGMHDD